MGKTIGVVLSLKDKCSPAIVNVAKKFGMAEKEAKKLNAQLRQQAKQVDGALRNAMQGATVVIGATIGAIGALTTKTIEFGDKIDKMSQKIGMSRKAYQEWDYVMSQNGGSVDSLQMGYKTLATQMGKVQTGSKESVAIFQKLGVTVKDSSGQLRSQEEVFNDSVRALQKIKNPTEKAILSQKLFGKAAIEMKPLLNQSAESVDALRQKANDLGMVMSDETIDASVKLTDTIDTLKRSFGAIGLTIGASFVPIVQKLADQLINNLPQIKATLTPAITGFANAIGFVCNHLDVIIPAVGALAGAFATLQIITAVTGFITAFCNPVGLAVVAISGLIAGIGVAYTKCAGFRAMVGAVISVVKLLAVGTWELIKPIAQFGVKIAMWLTPIGLVVNAVKMLIGGLNTLAQKMGGWKNIGNNIKNWADKKTDKIQHHALGTVSSQGGPAIVGEYGAELVNLPRGASVMNKNQTQKALSGGSNVTINLNIAGNMVGNREFMNEIMSAMALELRKVMPA